MGKLNNVIKTLGAVSRLVDYMIYEYIVDDEILNRSLQPMELKRAL